MSDRSTIKDLYNTLGSNKGKGGSFDSLPQRAVSRVQAPFLNRYRKKNGVIIGSGVTALYDPSIGVAVLEATIQHMKDHIQEEITHEVAFVGNETTVGDLKALLEALDKFL